MRAAERVRVRQKSVRCERPTKRRSEWRTTQRVGFIIILPIVECIDSLVILTIVECIDSLVILPIVE